MAKRKRTTRRRGLHGSPAEHRQGAISAYNRALDRYSAAIKSAESGRCESALMSLGAAKLAHGRAFENVKHAENTARTTMVHDMATEAADSAGKANRAIMSACFRRR